MDWEDLEDIERFQRLFVEPLVKSVREELKPLTTASADHTARLDKLEGNQKKAMFGFAGLTLVASTAIGLSVDWLRKRVGL